MIRLLILLILVFLAYTFFTGVRQLLTGQGKRNLPPKSGPKGEDMVRDPQCGIYLPRSEALKKMVSGRQQYFCSKECRDAFLGRK